MVILVGKGQCVFTAQEGKGWGETCFVVAEEINLCFVVLS